MSQAALSDSYGVTIPIPTPEPPVVLEEVGSIDMLLKSPKRFARMVSEDRVDLQPSLMLGITSMGLYAVYGLSMGCFAGGNSIWQATLKVPLVLIGTLALSAPGLYLALCLAGLAVSGRQVAAMLAGLAGVSSVILAGCAPVVWLFGISTSSVPFMVLFHVTVWGVAFGCGWRLLVESLSGGRGERKSALLWGLLTLVVCAQMVTYYRPLLGVTVTKTFREQQRSFFFQHFYASLTGGDQANVSAVPSQPASAPSIPVDPSTIPPPTVTPMSN